MFPSHKSPICHWLREKCSFWHLTLDCGKYFSFYHLQKSQLDALTIKCHVSKEHQKIIVALSVSQIYDITVNCDILTRYQNWSCIKIISCDLTCSRCHLSSRRHGCRNRHPWPEWRWTTPCWDKSQTGLCGGRTNTNNKQNKTEKQ